MGFENLYVCFYGVPLCQNIVGILKSKTSKKVEMKREHFGVIEKNNIATKFGFFHEKTDWKLVKKRLFTHFYHFVVTQFLKKVMENILATFFKYLGLQNHFWRTQMLIWVLLISLTLGLMKSYKLSMLFRLLTNNLEPAGFAQKPEILSLH